MLTPEGTPEFVYAESREEAQRLLDGSYLEKYEANPVGTLAEIDRLRGERDELSQERDALAMSLRRMLDRARVAEAQLEALREAVNGVLKVSLLDVRRACFAPEIGTKMTERWRSDMADSCRRLEDACRVALAKGGEAGGSGYQAQRRGYTADDFRKDTVTPPLGTPKGGEADAD